MAKMTSAINVNVDTKIKNEATAILKGLGLNMSTFINMALAQVVKRDGVPFEVVNPKQDEYDLYKYFTKEELEETAKELENMKKHPEKYPSYDNVDELFEALNDGD